MATPTPSRKRRKDVTDESWLRTQAAFANLLETITPWLLDLGNWIFGALIALNILILGALLTVGPVDRAVLVATASFALALPLDAAGFFLLRFAADMKTVDLDGVATKAFVDAGFDPEQVGLASDPHAVAKRRAEVVLRISYTLLALTLLVTLTGIAAALWHMAWWIGVLFVVSTAISAVAIGTGISTNGRRRPPPSK